MLADVHVVAQFSDARAAVTAALQQLVAYAATSSRTAVEELAEEHAPAALRRRPATRRAPSAGVTAFDIDDTLLFDRAECVIPHQEVVDLLLRVHALGAEVHLITARLSDPEVLADTEAELAELGLRDKYHSLSLAPPRARGSMAAVSRWKMQTRKRLAAERRCPITLTVGDQWGDMVVLEQDDDIDALDLAFATHTLPFIIVRPHDQVSLWGLKLPSYS